MQENLGKVIGILKQFQWVWDETSGGGGLLGERGRDTDVSAVIMLELARARA
jgi:hypothetical protein